MEIDIRTILLFSAVNSLFLFLLLLFFVISGRGDRWYLKVFTLGKTLITVGLLLIALRGTIPLFVSLVLANVLTFIGYNLELLSVTSFDGAFKRTSSWLYGLSAFFSSAVFCFIYDQPDYVRVSIMATFSVIPIAYTGFYFLKYKPSSALIKFIGYGYLITGLTHLIRGIHAFDLGEKYMYMFKQDTYEVTFFIIVNLSFFLGTVGFVMLLKERAENEINMINKRLQKEMKSLRNLNKEKNNFFSIISHDLRGPVGGLKSLSSIIIDENKITDSETKEMIELINLGANETFSLLNDLLEWANSQSSLNQPDLKEVGIFDLVKSNITLCQQQAEFKSITLINAVNEKVMVEADIRMTNTIIRNLIVNAIKFTPEHGQIKAFGEPGTAGMYHFCIEDNGVGMNEEVLQKLFVSSDRVTSLGTNQEVGTGLGLQLCQELIENMGGEIWADSKPGKGSRFWFSLKRSEEPGSLV